MSQDQTTPNDEQKGPKLPPMPPNIGIAGTGQLSSSANPLPGPGQGGGASQASSIEKLVQLSEALDQGAHRRAERAADIPLYSTLAPPEKPASARLHRWRRLFGYE